MPARLCGRCLARPEHGRAALRPVASARPRVGLPRCPVPAYLGGLVPGARGLRPRQRPLRSIVAARVPVPPRELLHHAAGLQHGLRQMSAGGGAHQTQGARRGHDPRRRLPLRGGRGGRRADGVPAQGRGGAAREARRHGLLRLAAGWGPRLGCRHHGLQMALPCRHTGRSRTQEAAHVAGDADDTRVPRVPGYERGRLPPDHEVRHIDAGKLRGRRQLRAARGLGVHHPVDCGVVGNGVVAEGRVCRLRDHDRSAHRIWHRQCLLRVLGAHLLQ
mmetsp:Transcript_125144/g.389578  ORF Transcript_125144/g.389578 Transcript_125144/m.389578 type:complete len:275 (-) Transcript_125144:319-1143(-)